MAREIDQRIVEMRFDNKQFESATKDTLGTLEKLKGALKSTDSVKAFEDLDKAARNVNLEGVLAGVEALEKRFSAMGIVGMTVIQNLTNGLINTLGRGINFVSDAIVSGGIKRAMNIENAHFQLQALLKDEEQVQAIMANAQKSVDGTAFGYDEAAKAASQFAASGVKAGEQMEQALRGIVGVAAMTNSEYEGIASIFTTVAGNGRLMGDQLLQLSSRGLNAASTIADFMNRVNEGTTQASAGVTEAIKAISKGTKVTEADIRDFVSKGKVSFGIFSEAMTEAFADSAERANETFTGAFGNMRFALAKIGAGFFSPLVEQNSKIVELFNSIRLKINEVKKVLVFDKEIGNVHALNLQFTNSVLGMAGSLSEFVKNFNLTNALSAFYYSVETVKNVVKGLLSVLAPVGKAFADVFSFSGEDVVKLTSYLYQLTSNLKLSDVAAENLRFTATVLFTILKLLAGVALALIAALFPIAGVIMEIVNAFSYLIRIISENVLSFVSWVRETGMVKAALDLISEAVQVAGKTIEAFVLTIEKFILAIRDLPIAQSILNSLKNAFSNFATVIKNVMVALKDALERFKELVGPAFQSALTTITDLFSSLIKTVTGADVSGFSSSINAVENSTKSFFSLIKSNKGITAFVTNMKEFFDNLINAFSVEILVYRITTFKTTITNFFKWVKSVLGTLFKNFSVGLTVSGGAGIAMIYGLIKAAKAFESIASSIKSIPNMLDGLKGALAAYQNDLNASALVKIAGAIGILAAAITLLSFADTDRLLNASVALGIVSAALLHGIAELKNAVNKGKNMADSVKSVGKSLTTVIRNFGEDLAYSIDMGIKNLTNAVKIHAISLMFKNLAVSIIMIIAAIVAVGYAYKKDSNLVEEGAIIVGAIAAVIVGMIAAMTILGNNMEKGMTAFAKASFGIFALASSINSCIFAVNKLFKMKFPSDWGNKLAALIAILSSLSVISVIFAKAASIADGKKINATPLIAFAVSLYLVLVSLNKIYGMELPDDVVPKTLIFAGIFTALAAVMLAMGVASKIAGGSIKAVGTILSICLYIGSIVGALLILSVIPIKKMIAGAGSLALVIAGLAAAMYGAGNIKGDVAKAVLAMALDIGVIVAALTILAIIPFAKMATGAVALAALLLVLTTNFNSLSKITDTAALVTVLGMIGLIVTIAMSLQALAPIPWEGLLAATVSLSATLLAFSGAVTMISKLKDVSMEKIALYLSATLALVPIAMSLRALSDQPWKNMLASAVSLSGTLLAFSLVFEIVSGTNVNIDSVLTFVLASVALLPISASLNMLGGLSWGSILPGAVSLAATASLLSAALIIMSKSGINPVAVLAFVTSAVSLIPIAAALKILSGLSWNEVATGLITLAGALTVIGVAGLLIGPISPLILAMSAALIVFGGAIAIVGVGLVSFVTSLLTTLDLLSIFLESLGNVTAFIDVGKNVIAGFIGGLIEGFSNVVDTVKSIGQGVISTICEVLGINSPSIIMKMLGLFTDLGFVEGVKEGSVEVDGVFNEVFGGLADKVDIHQLLTKGKEATDTFVSGVKNNGENVQYAWADVIDESAETTAVDSYENTGKKGVSNFLSGLLSGKEDVNNSFSSMLTNITGGIDLDNFGDLGEGGVKELLSGLQSGEGDVSDSLKNMLGDANLNVDMDQFYNTGEGGVKELLSGLQSGEVDASSTFETMLGSMNTDVDLSQFSSTGKSASEEFMSGFEDEFSTSSKETSNNLIKAIVEAIKGKFKDVTESGENTLDAYVSGFDNTSKSMTEVGKSFIDGIVLGIKNNAYKAAKEAATMARGIDTAVRAELDINSPSGDGEYDGKSYDDGVALGIEKNAPVVADAAANMAQTTVGELDLNQVYAVYGGYEKIDTMTDNIATEIQKGEEKVTKVSEDGMAARKVVSAARTTLQTNEIQAESDYWTKLLELKRQGADAEKYIDMSVADFQKEVLTETQEILQNYADQLESTTEKIMNTYDLFSEVERKEAKSKEEITKNLQEQISEYQIYTENLESLNARLGDSDLGKYLRTLSVDSVAQLQVLNSMTDDELTAYSNLYDQKMAAANNAAVAQLLDLRTESEQKLTDIFGTMDTTVNLYDFAAVFNGSIESITQYVTDLQTKFDTFNQTAKNIGMAFPQNLTTGVNEAMGSFSTNLGTSITTAVTNAVSNNGETVKEAAKPIGQNIEAGVAQGMSESTLYSEASTTLVDNIFTAMKTAGQINSPSERSATEIGLPLVQGIVKGMLDNSSILSEGISTAIGTAFTAMTTSIQTHTGEATAAMSTAAAGIVTAMQNGLPDTTFNGFGQNAMQQFINGVQAKQALAVTTTKNLCEAVITQMKTSLPDLTFKTIGQNAIQAFINGIINKRTLTQTTIRNLCSLVITTMRTNLPATTFKTFGQNIVQWVINGINDKKKDLTDLVQDLCDAIIKIFTDTFTEETLNNIGKSIVEDIKDGLTKNETIVTDQAKTLGENILTAFEGVFTEERLNGIGANVAKGLAEGIEAHINEIAQAAIEAAEAAIKNAEEALEIASPSKVFYRMGGFVSLGLAKGILSKTETIENATSEMASKSAKAMREAVDSLMSIISNGDFDTEIKLTPIVDLSGVEESAEDIAKLFNQSIRLSTDYEALKVAGTIRRGSMEKTRKEESKEKQVVEQKFEFQQNNYSPKSLSRSEIYRQTNNQFAAFKRAVKVV